MGVGRKEDGEEEPNDEDGKVGVASRFARDIASSAVPTKSGGLVDEDVRRGQNGF